MEDQADAIARQFWDVGHRIAKHIAEQPPELREAAFLIVERRAREMAKDLRLADNLFEEFVKLQLDVVRQSVADIDASRRPGRA